MIAFEWRHDFVYEGDDDDESVPDHVEVSFCRRCCKEDDSLLGACARFVVVTWGSHP